MAHHGPLVKLILIVKSGGSRNFKTERRGPGAVESMQRFVLMPPSHIPYVL